MRTIFFVLLIYGSITAQDVLIIHREALTTSPSYTVEASRYFTAVENAGGTLSDSQKTNINDFCECLKDSFVIDSLAQIRDIVYLFANQDSIASKMNLVKRSHDAVVFGTMSFEQWRGWTGDASTGYLHTNYNLSSDGVTFSRNACGMGIYSRTNSALSGIDCGVYNNNSYGVRMRLRYTNDLIYVNLNGSSNYFTYNNSSGYFLANRDVSTSFKVFRNASEIQSITNTTNVDPLNLNMVISAVNSNGTITSFTNRQYAEWDIGLNFDETQQRKYYNCLQRYLSEIGAGL